MTTIFCIISTLLFTCTVTSTRAQELSISDPGLDAAIRDALQKPNGPLTEQDLLSLTNLDARNRNISSVDGLGAARNLISLDLLENNLTSLAFPAGLTNLTSLFLQKNPLTNLVLPPDLMRLFQMDLTGNQLTKFTLPAALTNLSVLALRGNQLTNFILPADLAKLTSLSLGGNQLTNFILPAGLTNLISLDLGGNPFTSLRLPAGLINLTGLFLDVNQLTTLTLPPDMTNLTALSFLVSFLDPHPLTTLVLSEPLAASTNLIVNMTTLANVQSFGLSVFTYPLTVQLTSPRRTAPGDFEFTLTGPPGIYAVLASSDLTSWSDFAAVTNELGFARFDDGQANLSPQKFYRARSSP